MCCVTDNLVAQIIHPLFTDLVDAWSGCPVTVYEMPSLDGSGAVPAAQVMYRMHRIGKVPWPAQEIVVMVAQLRFKFAARSSKLLSGQVGTGRGMRGYANVRGKRSKAISVAPQEQRAPAAAAAHVGIIEQAKRYMAYIRFLPVINNANVT